MPEGDTVYALARRLDTALRDRVLDRGELRVPARATEDLAGRTVLAHVTHDKHLLTRLSGDLTLHTHLRMSGSWTVSATGRWLPRDVMPDVRVVLRTDGPAAYGVGLPVVELLRTRDEADVIGHLGPDPLRPDWDLEEAVARGPIPAGRWWRFYSTSAALPGSATSGRTNSASSGDTARGRRCATSTSPRCSDSVRGLSAIRPWCPGQCR